MRIAYFDCFSGISGDMALGALIDGGADANELIESLKGLGLGEDWHLHVERVMKGAISALSVTVHAHEHTGAHTHEHPHQPSTTGHGTRGTGQEHERHLSDIKQLIEHSDLPAPVKQKSIAAFEALGRAEAKIHGIAIEDVHFHEVGAIDSIIDTVGVILALHLLGVEEVYASRLPFSTGRIQTAHGELPVPAPATLELMKGVPMYPVNVEAELITPTGAALLKTLARSFGTPPPFIPLTVGYGAGQKDLPHSNVLRVILGEAISHQPSAISQERLVLLETNIDDMSPQLCEHVMERLMAEGALDAFITPVQMKKSRPGLLLSVLCGFEQTQPLMRVLFEETTTLGVRKVEVDRFSLPREVVTVQTPYGSVRVKVATLDGKVVNAAPEYEDCKAIAQQTGVPLKTILAAAISSVTES